MTKQQEDALDWSMLITACTRNDRKEMHSRLGNLIYTAKLGKFKDRLLKQLDDSLKEKE